MEQMLTVEEVALYLKAKISTIRYYLRRNIISGFKIGKEWRIPENNLNIFIEKLKKHLT